MTKQLPALRAKPLQTSALLTLFTLALAACGDGGVTVDEQAASATAAPTAATDAFLERHGDKDFGPGGRSTGPALAPKVLDPATNDKRPVGYASLLFADEFGGTSLNRNNWCTRLMWGGSEDTPPLQVPDVDCVGWSAGVLDFVNDEQHRFRDYDSKGQELHSVAGGVLKLRATVKSSDPADLTFESAMIRGKELLVPDANKSYYITGRYRLSDVKGTLPQAWLAPSLEPAGVAQWPPEIDIFEGPYNDIDGADDLYQVTQVRAQQTSTGQRRMFDAVSNYNEQFGFITESSSLRERWLEIGAEWTKDAVCFFIDGKKTVCDYYRWVSNNGIQGNPATFMVNMAVGGSWAGRDGIDLSKFPTSLDIDYIRIYQRTHRALSGRAGDITAAATLSGQQPQPTKFPDSTAYYAVNTSRLDGGAIQATNPNAWSVHSIDAGAPASNPHEYTFAGLTGTTGFGVNFAGVQATNASNTGTSAGSGYSARLTRTSATAAWTARLVKNNGAGTAPVVLQTTNAAMPATADNATITVNVIGSQVRATVTADTGAVTVLSANDTAHRGNFVGAEVFAASGTGPAMTAAYGVDVLAPAVIPGPTPGQAPAVPEVTYPTSNSTLFGTSQISYWWGDGVTQWWLYAGSVPGASDYFDSGNLGSTAKAVVTGLPVNGSTVHYTLFYKKGSAAWQSVASTYTAAGVAPSVTSPAAGSTLAGASRLFEWAGGGVTEWWVHAGSTAGAANYFNSGSLGSATNVNVTGLPTSGSTVHLRLYHRNGNGAWRWQDTTYTAVTAAAPTIASPAANATLAGASQIVQWNGAGVAEWWLYAGATPGANNFFDSGSLGTSASVTMTGLPTNGNPVHVRLWYRYSGGAWQTIDRIYTAAGTGPSVTSPAQGATLSGASRAFQWGWQGGSALQYWVYAGSSPGASNYYDSGSLGTATTATVTGLPANGSQVFVTLWYRTASGWQSVARTYTSGP